MASILSTPSAPMAALSYKSGLRTATIPHISSLSTIRSSMFGGLRLVNMVQRKKSLRTTFSLCGGSKTEISCSLAHPETLQIVRSTIAKQLSIDKSTVTPQTKFADLGADSLDTVEIMMSLEEKFGVSIGEQGAENISTVQDAANLIEKVKTDSA